MPDNTEFWVVGGEYTDTTFSRLAPGATEERFGPFPNYDDARAEWQKQSWAHVDECNVRFRIVEEG